MAKSVRRGKADASPRLHATVFALKAKSFRAPGVATADCGQLCTAEDGCDYAIKDTARGTAPLVPHSEWFCSELSEAVQIAAPGHKIIDMLDGSYAFGSRWLGGVVKPALGGYWFHRVQSGFIPLSQVSPILSHIYAFDQFIHNVDRHGGNFIIHDQQAGHAVLAMDYSRAWITNGFPLPPVPLSHCNTVEQQRLFRNLWKTSYVDPVEADVTLEKLRGIPVSKVARIIAEHPENWLPQTTKNAILKWWQSADMLHRLDTISAGIRDGTCL